MVLSAFFERVPVERLAVPRNWPAPRALEALAAEHAGLDATRQQLEARWERLAEELLAATA